MSVDDQYLTTGEVSELAGVTLRQLQWWDEHRLITAHHKGHRRIYSLEQAIEVCIIGRLRERGFSLDKAREILKKLTDTSQALADSSTPSLYIVASFDASDLVLCADSAAVMRVATQSVKPVIIVSVDEAIDTVLRKRRNEKAMCAR